MRFRACGWIGLLIALAGATGCQTRTAGQRFLSFIGVQKKPLSIALATDTGAEAALGGLNPFPKYADLQKAMQADLDRPVVVEPCFAFQAESGLKSGWFDLAIVSPAHYAAFRGPETYRAIAMPVDAHGRVEQRAVLIVLSRSSLREPGDLKGESVAFGPKNDTLTHHAALKFLREHGVGRGDLAPAALPLSGTLRHYPYDRAVAQSVLSGSAEAGFVTEAYWETLPLHDDADDVPANNKFRVLGYTATYPLGLVLCSPKVSDAAAEELRECLLKIGRTRPAALAPLEISGYAVPDETILVRCRQLPVHEADIGRRNDPLLEDAEMTDTQPAE